MATIGVLDKFNRNNVRIVRITEGQEYNVYEEETFKDNTIGKFQS